MPGGVRGTWGRVPIRPTPYSIQEGSLPLEIREGFLLQHLLHPLKATTGLCAPNNPYFLETPNAIWGYSGKTPH